MAFLAVATALNATHGASTINPTNHYAWGGNAGWVDFRAERPNAGDGFKFGEFSCSGWLWSPNLGWINCGNGSPADGISYANSDNADYGVNHYGTGELYGLAWAPNVGWISFGWATLDPTNTFRPRVDLVTGEFSGYAWSANCGWINLGSGQLKTDRMEIVDTDGDGISDTWELEHAPTTKVLTATGDADNDGITDVQEYLLDTDPLVPNAPFRITRIAKIPNVNSVEMEWPSRPTRIYGIDAKLDLTATNWLFLANVPGAAGTNTIQAIESGAQPKAFFRVAAKLPLTP